ncbi:hypothetical protein [Phormidium nigroviride]
METAPKLMFKYGWDERDEVETPMKGCRSDGIVSLSNGEAYSVYFIDPIRLQQDLDAEVECGSPFLAPPGLIVLPELTRSAMENAIAQLWKQGYFDSLKPISEIAQKANFNKFINTVMTVEQSEMEKSDPRQGDRKIEPTTRLVYVINSQKNASVRSRRMKKGRLSSKK